MTSGVTAGFERMCIPRVELERTARELFRFELCDRGRQALEGLITQTFLEEVCCAARFDERTRTTLHILQWRFGVPLPADVVIAIVRSRDRFQLNGYFKLAATVASLDDFRRESLAMKRSAYLEEIRNKVRHEERRRTIAQVLRLRCGVPLPTDLVDAIMQTHNLVRLDRWLEIAATVATLDDFRRECGI
jgi:hypothetical protein